MLKNFLAAQKFMREGPIYNTMFPEPFKPKGSILQENLPDTKYQPQPHPSHTQTFFSINNLFIYFCLFCWLGIHSTQIQAHSYKTFFSLSFRYFTSHFQYLSKGSLFIFFIFFPSFLFFSCWLIILLLVLLYSFQLYL